MSDSNGTSNNNGDIKVSTASSPDGCPQDEVVPSPIHKDRADVEPTLDEAQESPEDFKIAGVDSEEVEVLSDSHQSLLVQLIKSGQLVVGLDLTKVVLPTFILEPRSLLEKLSDFWMHPGLFTDIANPAPIDGYGPEVSRMIRVVRWYMSGFHVRPRGVKKPYNPIIGEQFECTITDPTQAPSGAGSSEGSSPPSSSGIHYVAEQVSHHPPVSALYVRSDASGLSLHCNYYPRSKFLGNSAASISEGVSVLLVDGGEAYYFTMPTIYVRGLVFGKLLLELGGKAEITCPAHGLQVDIDFKVKGYFTGEYNAVVGGIFYTKKGYKNPEVVFSGKWNEVMHFHPGASKKEPQVLVDVRATPLGQRRACNTTSIPDSVHSHRVWKGVTAALRANNVELATQEKTAVEQRQRDVRKEHAAAGTTHSHRSFVDLNPSCAAGAARDYRKLQWVYAGRGVKLHPALEGHLSAVMTPELRATLDSESDAGSPKADGEGEVGERGASVVERTDKDETREEEGN
eukprot:PhM_4_TR2761/c0_g1_i1/m.12919